MRFTAGGFQHAMSLGIIYGGQEDKPAATNLCEVAPRALPYFPAVRNGICPDRLLLSPRKTGETQPLNTWSTLLQTKSSSLMPTRNLRQSNATFDFQTPNFPKRSAVSLGINCFSSHRARIKGELGRELHRSAQTEGVHVKHRVVGVQKLCHRVVSLLPLGTARHLQALLRLP